MDQIIIKSLLVLAFVLLGMAMLRSSGSARTEAIRTLGLLLFLIAAIVAVLFPGLVNDVAQFVGVSRGTDLVLYAFLVVFIGHLLSNARKRRRQDAQITELARKMALSSPIKPGDAEQ